MKTNRSLLIAAATLLPASLAAQSAIDAYNLSQTELRGTARFMSMAGAFTALGGDLSTLNQNPAGIGVYHGSDIGITVDFNFLNTKTSEIGAPFTRSQTHVDVNNVGYVGTFNMPNLTFSWGFSYSRQMSFQREYQGQNLGMQTSLSNYITTFTDGYPVDDLKFTDNFDPYQNSSINAPAWMSVLAYNSGMITPVVKYDADGQPYETTTYDGLWQYPVDGQPGITPTTGLANFFVREKGNIDEYTINFGGSVQNIFNWGIGIGIDDLSFTQDTYYEENLNNANVPSNSSMGIEEGNGGFGLSNTKYISGNGVNAKFGIIVKPINEFRIGMSVATPTYWSITTSYRGTTDFSYSSGVKGNEYTNDADYDWKLNSPWKLNVGMAGVVGGRGILSVDYEYQGYGSMKSKDAGGNEYVDYTNDMKTYYKSVNTLRLGAEFRVTPQLSLRAGYAYSSTAVNDDAADSNVEIYTSGTNPSYTFNTDTQYITCGIGYRFGGFYADAAYVHKHREGKYHAFTSFKDYDGYWYDGPSAKVTDNNSQLVLTLGYKF